MDFTITVFTTTVGREEIRYEDSSWNEVKKVLQDIQNDGGLEYTRTEDKEIVYIPKHEICKVSVLKTKDDEARKDTTPPITEPDTNAPADEVTKESNDEPTENNTDNA